MVLFNNRWWTDWFGKSNYIAIVTLEAYNSFKRYFGTEKVYPIYINIEDGLRLERALTRERNQKSRL